MFHKVVHLESLALEVYFNFVRYICTQTWISGIDVSQAQYRGKPSDGDRRTVTIWQGSKNSYHQRLEVYFFYHQEFGGWNLNGVIFAGNTVENEDWSQAFQGGPKHDDAYTWRFTPVRFDGYYFQDYDLRDEAQNEEFNLACKGQFPRALAS